MHDKEIEIRYKLKDLSAFEAKLKAQGAEFVSEKRVVDYWFVPVEISNDKQQAEWFDSGKGCGLRIREVYDGGKVASASLGTKRVTDPLGHKALSEAEVMVGSYEEAKKLLVMMDRKEFLVIDKIRKVFNLQQFEVVIDTIQNYGSGVEIELHEQLDPEEGVKKIAEFALSLGLSPEDEHEKSITVSAMHELAKY